MYVLSVHDFLGKGKRDDTNRVIDLIKGVMTRQGDGRVIAVCEHARITLVRSCEIG